MPTNGNDTPQTCRVLISGIPVRDEDIPEGGTLGDLVARLAETGVPTDRIETFYVDGVPAHSSDILRAGAQIVGSPKSEGGSR